MGRLGIGSYLEPTPEVQRCLKTLSVRLSNYADLNRSRTFFARSRHGRRGICVCVEGISLILFLSLSLFEIASFQISICVGKGKVVGEACLSIILFYPSLLKTARY